MGLNSTAESINSTENYGQGYYIGTVTANNDTVGIGRVQANVPGLFDPNSGEVPFIGPLKDSPYGFGTGSKGPYGVYGFPQVGSMIKVELQNGDEHKPLYTPLLTAPNAHPWFNVPSRWGYVDPAGNSLQVDMNAGSWVWTHQSGDTVSYDGSGDVINVVKGNLTNTVSGNVTDTISGNQHSTISGSLTFNVTGSATITCSSYDLTANGTATYSASEHIFNGPITASATISAAEDITDSTSLGNGQTMADMREIYNEHYHVYDDDGHPNDTDPPTPQIP
jgi:hypothetical protein